MKFVLYCLLTLPMALSCSSKSKVEQAKEEIQVKKIEERPNPESTHVAVEIGADRTTEVSFAKGSSTLSDEAKKALTEMVQKIDRKKEIDSVQVAAWSDREYPSDDKKELSQKDRDLAKRRGQAIEAFLKSQGPKNKLSGWNISIHNMAERPTQLESVVGSPDAEVKHSIESAGVPTLGEKAKTPSKASKALVLIKYKKEVPR